MGGFASSVQQPQTSGQSSGKGGPVGQAVEQVAERTDGLDQNAINADPQGFQQWQQQRDQQYQAPRPMGKGGVQTNSATSGQPRIGMQNQYSNTVGQWDNTQIQPVQRNGKGKGA
jgi:hypothetical protein